MSIQKVISDDVFHKAARAVADRFERRIKDGSLSEIPPQVFLFVITPDGEKDVVSSMLNKLPDDERVLSELMKHIGQCVSDKTNGVPFMATVVSSEVGSTILGEKQESVVVSTVTVDGRSVAHNIYVKRNGDNTMKYDGRIMSDTSRTTDALSNVFKGAAIHIASKLSGVISGAIRKERGEHTNPMNLPDMLGNPVKIEFSKN